MLDTGCWMLDAPTRHHIASNWMSLTLLVVATEAKQLDWSTRSRPPTGRQALFLRSAAAADFNVKIVFLLMEG
jgi:hypothetical protein